MVEEPLIRDELNRILASPLFSNAYRIRRFLRFVVEEALAGVPERIKEYSIALEVFDKDILPARKSTGELVGRRLRAKGVW